MRNKLLVAAVVLLFSNTIIAQQIPLTLKESIRYGLTNHTSVQIGANKIQIAKEKKREALANYLPQVNINGTLDDNLKVQSSFFPAIPITLPDGQTFTMGGGAVAFGTKYNTNLIGQLDQQVYNQQIMVGIKAAEPNNQLAEFGYEQTKQTVIYNIAHAYYQIIIAQKRIQLLSENKKRYEELLRVVTLRQSQGIAKKTDILQTQLNLNNTNAQLSVSQNAYNVALNSFKTNMGIDQKTPVNLTDTSKWLNKAPSEMLMPDFDYANNIDKKLQETQINLLQLNVESIKSTAYPTVSVYARYGLNGFGDKLGQAFDPLRDFASIGVKFAWNPFTGFGRDAKIKQARYEVENAVETLKLNEQMQSLAFQNARTQMTTAYNTITVNRQNLALAQEVYDNTNLQYKQGMAQLSDLLNVELSMWTAQNNYMQSLLDFYIAELELNKANGTLNNYYQNL